MKKSLLLGLILNLFFNFLYGQLNSGNSTVNGLPVSDMYSEDALLLPYPKSDYTQILGLRSDNLREIYNKNLKNGVDGSPYLYESWDNSSKIFYKDKIYSINTLNYNLYADRFEAKLSLDSVFALNPESVKKVILNNRVFREYLEPESQISGYYEELGDFEGYRLLRKYSVKVKDAPVNPLTNVKVSNDELVQSEVFYIIDLTTNNLNKIKLKKSDIEPLFKKEKLNSLNKFVKANHLKYNDTDDIGKIIRHYNTL